MFLSHYQDRPATLNSDHTVEVAGRKGTVYSLHDFEITCWEDGAVTANRKYFSSTDPKRTFPNMTVVDGNVNFPIEDLVSFILAKIPAEELAEGIIGDDEARAALVEKMAERYASPGFEDADRRKFLIRVQQQVHAEAVQRTIERLNRMEERLRCKDDYYRWKSVEIGHYTGLYEAYERVLQELHEAGKLDDAQVKRRMSVITEPGKLRQWLEETRDPVWNAVISRQWQESRDHWRKVLEEILPEPREENGGEGDDNHREDL